MTQSGSLEAHPNHNLPPQPTPFVGRDPEIAELVALLNQSDCRLLTLVGPGGIGKTRLSIEAALRQAETFAHGICFVPLAPLNTAADMVTTVINVLGIYLGDDGSPREQLITFLSQRNLLLIMDNFEHVLDGADLLSDILQIAPDVKVLATSREGLNLREEWVWQVKGMRFPQNDDIADIEDYSALKLFLDRAQRVRRDFSIADEQACAIRICQLVGGMPLAIELAASWRKTLACGEIVAEIQRSIDFLTSSARNVPERHRSIRAVCDHSWSLCNETEQAVFSKLCVFRDGFEREAAEEIAGASLLTLSALVEKSMLRKLPSGRYEIHELLRQYAEDKLRATGEWTAIEKAHTRYYAEFMQARTPDIKGRRQLAGLNEIEADFENVWVVWQRAIDKADYDVLDQMMESLALFCDMRARYQAGEDLLQKAVKTLAPQDGEETHPVWNRLRARWIQVWILQERRPVPQSIWEQLEDCLTVAKQNNDVATTALCLWSSGELNRFGGTDTESIPLYQVALTQYRDLGDEYYVVRVLRGMAFCDVVRKIELERWDNWFELNRQHLNLAREIGDQTGLAHAVAYEGMVILHTGGSKDSAENFVREASAIWQKMGDRKSLSAVLRVLGSLCLFNGELENAKALATEGMEVARSVNYLVNMWPAMGLLGFVAALEGNYAKASQLCEESLPRYRYGPPIFAQLGLFIISLRAEDFDRANELAQSMLNNVGWPMEIMASLPAAALILAHEGDNVPAVELLGLAFTHPAAITGWMEKWELLTQLRHNLEAELGVEAYQAAWERGEQRDLDETIAELREYFGSEPIDAPKSTPQPLVEPLSERELEVLALLAEGLSNREIAERLYLSVGTVKVHTRNIYGKLSVGNRTEAAATARNLNLL